jgi:integrase
MRAAGPARTLFTSPRWDCRFWALTWLRPHWPSLEKRPPTVGSRFSSLPLTRSSWSVWGAATDRSKPRLGFPSPKKYSRTGHFSLSTVEHQFVDARCKAGLPEALVLYCARHTYATDTLARTGNMAAVMDALGHANVQTTMIYQHQGLDQIRSAINLRNKENQTSAIKPSHGTEASFGQNLGQSHGNSAVGTVVSD